MQGTTFTGEGTGGKRDKMAQSVSLRPTVTVSKLVTTGGQGNVPAASPAEGGQCWSCSPARGSLVPRSPADVTCFRCTNAKQESSRLPVDSGRTRATSVLLCSAPDLTAVPRGPQLLVPRVTGVCSGVCRRLQKIGAWSGRGQESPMLPHVVRASKAKVVEREMRTRPQTSS